MGCVLTKIAYMLLCGGDVARQCQEKLHLLIALLTQ